MLPDGALAALRRYPLLDALRERRSRRFGLGMAMDAGPLAYRSRHPGLRLTEGEEALLAFAACGITGYALADLAFGPGQGGTIMAGLVGRTIGSGDAVHSVAVFVATAEQTYLLKRPRDFAPAEIPELVALAEAGDYVALYRRSRVEIHAGRTAPPLEAPFNLDVNRWSLYDPAGTYFLPVNDLTLLYLNGVLEIFGETTGAFVVDERAGYRPAGLGRFARSRGGHLHDDPREGRVLTIRELESLVSEFATIEQGMVVQNLGLMTQALGLGGFPHWGAHPFGWLRALGFRMTELPASRYLGMSRPLAWLSRLLGRDVAVPLALGLEAGGVTLLTPFCPPYHASMEAAVRAVVELKFGPEGVFRQGTRGSAWREPTRIAETAPAPSPATVDATIAYATYLWERYGRFPAYAPPFRTVLGFQANHVDVEFYDRFYQPTALAATQREHLARWHGGTPNGDPAR
ncbi:MAG TPA: hypothetical protein VHO73_11040 [Methylomirabilota bacterium]|nr:hypothetical protein [Methylomirabilota bacterium]